MHYENYIRLTRESSPTEQLAQNIDTTVAYISSEHIQQFEFNGDNSGLLLGNVQSGKTGHMLGVLADAADHGFDIFIILTTDNVDLQQQTYERALKLLDTFCVCGEQDDTRFFANDMRKPVVVILKKNSRVLSSWKEHLVSSNFLQGRAVFIIDDEGDAASLNTKVNKDEVSTINQKISEIRDLSSSSFYLQVTATPQSLFLQSEETKYRPEFVYYFRPGEGYLGGDFFYKADASLGNQMPPVINFTEEDELSDLIDISAPIPEGLQEAISSFLIAAADIRLTKSRASCNFLIHPSVSISAHEETAEKVGEALNNLLHSMRYNKTSLDASKLKDAWDNLKQTKASILDFEKCADEISSMLENEDITISVMNSKTKRDVNFSQGVNIIVGGNSLGRGVTFPNLQTTYYCRKSKRPQADTAWQHCRSFGYDREAELVRMFLPPTLFKLFAELNDSNNAIIDCVCENDLNSLNLQYPKGIRPTRSNVIDKSKLRIISGGVNYFPSYSKNSTSQDIDALIETFSENEEYHDVNIELVLKILQHCGSDKPPTDWRAQPFIDCIKSLNNEQKKEAALIVRKERSIQYGSGTLLSPNDRILGGKFEDKVTLTMYCVDGKKGWDDKRVWIPNIKLPKKIFYNIAN